MHYHHSPMNPGFEIDVSAPADSRSCIIHKVKPPMTDRNSAVGESKLRKMQQEIL